MVASSVVAVVVTTIGVVVEAVFVVGTSVVIDWAVSFISSTDSVALDSVDSSSVTIWTLFAASARNIEASVFE